MANFCLGEISFKKLDLQAKINIQIAGEYFRFVFIRKNFVIIRNRSVSSYELLIKKLFLCEITYQWIINIQITILINNIILFVVTMLHERNC